MKFDSFALGCGLLVVSASICACSITATPGSGGGASDPGTAVKSQPLAGTINGKPFTAKVAIARPGFSGSGKQIDVYDVDATCDQQPALASGDHEILLDVASWTDGAAYQLDTGHSLTFVEEPANNFVTFTGRVEVTKAGTSEEPGTISLRANDEDKGSVEGQVKVLNCGQ
jgi:hypothetical protein